jgi:glutamate carboxypeptidase
MTGARFLAAGRVLALGLAIVMTGATGAQPARDEALWAMVSGGRERVAETLRELVSIESPSSHAPGLQAIGDLLDKRLVALGATVERVAAQAPSAGSHVVGRIRGSGSSRVLLMAHMDTIYPVGTLAARPFRIDGERAFGPGIADDRGGIAMILHSVEILKRRRFADFADLTVLFNTDEEIGSPDSGKLVTRLAAAADVVLSFEPTSTPREALTRGTAGNGEARVTVRGRAAHAGAEPERGRNALAEAADIVARTQGLDEAAKAFRFNWTRISSGTVLNQIPDQATLSADVRYFSEELVKQKLDELRGMLAKRRVPDTEAELKFLVGRPAFVADAASNGLIERAVAIYGEVGGTLLVVPRITGGTDAGFAQQSGRPVIEGMGMPGFGYHSSSEEYVALDRIPARLYLALRLIADHRVRTAAQR